MKLLLILSFIPLVMMSVSDFNTRRINSIWLIILFIVNMFYIINKENFSHVFTCFLVNCLIVIAIFTLAIVSAKSFLGLLKYNSTEIIGMGDLLFFMTVSPLFNPVVFIKYLTASFAFSLLYPLAGNSIAKTIPLVTTSSIIYFLYIILIEWNSAI